MRQARCVWFAGRHRLGVWGRFRRTGSEELSLLVPVGGLDEVVRVAEEVPGDVLLRPANDLSFAAAFEGAAGGLGTSAGPGGRAAQHDPPESFVGEPVTARVGRVRSVDPRRRLRRCGNSGGPRTPSGSPPAGAHSATTRSIRTTDSPGRRSRRSVDGACSHSRPIDDVALIKVGGHRDQGGWLPRAGVFRQRRLACQMLVRPTEQHLGRRIWFDADIIERCVQHVNRRSETIVIASMELGCDRQSVRTFLEGGMRSALFGAVPCTLEPSRHQ